MSSTRDRLTNIIDHHLKSASAGTYLSVAELSMKAKLSRTTIYRLYPDVVERLRLLREPQAQARKDKEALKYQMLKNRYLAQKVLIQQLSKACVELLAELSDTREDQRSEREAFQLRVSTLESKLRAAAKVTPLTRKI